MKEFLWLRSKISYKKNAMWLLILAWPKFRKISYSLSNMTGDFFLFFFWLHHSSTKTAVAPVAGAEPLPHSIYLSSRVYTACQGVWLLTYSTYRKWTAFRQNFKMTMGIKYSLRKMWDIWNGSDQVYWLNNIVQILWFCYQDSTQRLWITLSLFSIQDVGMFAV